MPSKMRLLRALRSTPLSTLELTLQLRQGQRMTVEVQQLRQREPAIPPHGRPALAQQRIRNPDGCESSHCAIKIKLVADPPEHGLADDLAPKDGIAGNG